ncbi:major facilitator superfamily domain-containing protein [Xylariales sp. AK1849]|nr:major facilitator superfamily domain-containing protein [Xylariales sp. AK1849]
MSVEKPLPAKVEATAEKSDGSMNVPLWTEAEETAVRHKLDWQLVPTVTVLYLLCFLDRANIGNARIQGMGDELNLNINYRFNWALSIFYIVYLLFEVPSNIILKRVGPRFFIPGLVVGFGFVSMCTAFVKTFEQLCGLRALLGVFEGGAMPGIAFYLSSFYKRRELYFRIGIYVSASSMAGAFGGLLATALTRIPTWGIASSPIHTWRNIFFFEGLLTMFIGALAPIILPQSPSTSKRLTDREKWIAEERLQLEHKTDSTENVKPKHVKRAVKNIMNYICAGGFFMINVTVQGISVFMPTVLADLGWTSTKAQLYSVPPYVLASVVAITISFVSDKTRMRGLYLAAFTFLGITGFSILRWSHNENLKYMAVFFVAIGAFPGGPGFLSWGINNSAGPAVRAVSSGYIVSIGTAGGILATWAYLATDGPDYPIGHSINLGAQLITLVLAISGICYCVWENRLRDRGGRDHRLEGLTEQQKTDLGYRHPEFRYIA